MSDQTKAKLFSSNAETWLATEVGAKLAAE